MASGAGLERARDRAWASRRPARLAHGQHKRHSRVPASQRPRELGRRGATVRRSGGSRGPGRQSARCGSRTGRPPRSRPLRAPVAIPDWLERALPVRTRRTGAIDDIDHPWRDTAHRVTCRPCRKRWPQELEDQRFSLGEAGAGLACPYSATFRKLSCVGRECIKPKFL